MSTTTLAPRYTRTAPVRSQSRPVPGELRLTRRGRLVVILGALMLMFAVGVWLAAGATGTSESGTQTPTESVIVAPGDTLWDIASDAAASSSSSDDTADMMERISDLNALDSSMLVAGQHLRVPTD